MDDHCPPVFSTGAIGLTSFTGLEGVDTALAFTSPLMRTIFSGALVALLLIVTLLLMGPSRLVSYFTVTSVLAPGATGAVSHFGTVQPQLPLQVLMINGWSPVLVTLNSQVPLAPLSIEP